MNIVSTPNEWRAVRRSIANQSLGFVATMGNLHQGHLALCQRSQTDNDKTVVSIFVNPTQFNQQDDFKYYPRTLEQDIALLEQQGVDCLFLPKADDLYPDRYQLRIQETEIAKELEGEFRPGHFDGMLTIVLKLLNIIQPDHAYFGEKDYQQYLLVDKMVQALFVPTKIIPVATERAKDGLALSSRNSRLDMAQRGQVVNFATLLQSDLAVEEIKLQLTKLGFEVEYIAEKWGRRLGAVVLDGVRLIDNVRVSPSPLSPLPE